MIESTKFEVNSNILIAQIINLVIICLIIYIPIWIYRKWKKYKLKQEKEISYIKESLFNIEKRLNEFDQKK
tara:strand:+ start:613 stop:825 length:213 start_codon:yes stop_codon:yes gene_type:complete